ncbi:MAG: serine hydrolase domain-containing protein [Bacteroidota bacterium]
MRRSFLLLISLFMISNCYSQELSEINKILHEIDSIRTFFNIPATAFGVVSDDSVLLQGAIGVRQINTNDSVTIDDKFHIGSNTKALTSFIAGKLVDNGLISWNTKFFDLFPELKTTSKQGYYEIELKDLLSHRALINPFKGNAQWKVLEQFYELNDEESRTFYDFSKFLLTQEPVKYDSTETYKYSNAGYLLAALMLEKVSNKTYKQLLEKTNQDLGVDFQIGWPRQLDNNQPVGYISPIELGLSKESGLTEMPDSILNDKMFKDFQYYCLPAGDICVSISDYLKFIQLNLSGLNGHDNYLKAETYEYIFTGEKEYALGWGNWIKNGNHYHDHSGTLATFYSYTFIVPELNVGIVIMMNAGNGKSKGGLFTIKEYLENKYAL